MEFCKRTKWTCVFHRNHCPQIHKYVNIITPCEEHSSISLTVTFLPFSYLLHYTIQWFAWKKLRFLITKRLRRIIFLDIQNVCSIKLMEIIINFVYCWWYLVIMFVMMTYNYFQVTLVTSAIAQQNEGKINERIRNGNVKMLFQVIFSKFWWIASGLNDIGSQMVMFFFNFNWISSNTKFSHHVHIAQDLWYEF